MVSYQCEDPNHKIHAPRAQMPISYNIRGLVDGAKSFGALVTQPKSRLVTVSSIQIISDWHAPSRLTESKFPPHMISVTCLREQSCLAHW